MNLAFSIKVLIGLFFLYLYTYYYGDGELSQDAGAFMRESKILNDVFYKSPKDFFSLLTGWNYTPDLYLKHLGDTSHWDPGDISIFNDTKTIIQFHSLVHFISFNQPAIHMMIMCLFSLIGIKHLYIGLQRFTNIKPSLLFWSIFFVPSILFWSSGILKESFLILALGLMVRALFADESNRKRVIFGSASILIFLFFKQYILIAFIPSFIFYVSYRSLKKIKILGALGILILFITAGTFLFQKPRDFAVNYLSKKQYDFNNVGRGGLHVVSGDDFYYFSPKQYKHLEFEYDSVILISEVDAVIFKQGTLDKPKDIHLSSLGDKWFIYFINEPSDGFIALTPIDESLPQLIKNIPEAVSNTLFRPFPGDPGGMLKIFAMLESFLVFAFLIFALLKRKTIDKDKLAIIVALGLFIFFMSLLIGWTTPVIGAIARYRIPIYLVILMISFILFDPPKIFTNEKQ